MEFPEQYAWLKSEGMPRMIQEAVALYGTLEFKDDKKASTIDDNPAIIGWAKEIGGKVADMYKADAIPWCGLFVGVVAKRAGKSIPKNPLWALSWSAFGTPVDRAMLGDVLVFTRPGGGHVALYVGEDDNCFHVLGGNQRDSVCVTRIERGRLYAVRRPNYSVMPGSVAQIYLRNDGSFSTNEV